MSARTEIPTLLSRCGWWRLTETDSKIVYYRWLPRTIREELCIRFDKAGRVSAWTIWHNQRITTPDQEPHNRTRLTDYIQVER